MLDWYMIIANWKKEMNKRKDVDYTLGTDVDRRKGMNKGREGDNGHRKRFPL